MSVYELDVAVASGIIIPIVAILVSVFLAYKPEHIPFKLKRHHSPVNYPFESKTAIEVFHPEKPIEKCKVIYNGHELICEESNLPHVTVLTQSTALFRIPSNMEVEEAQVIVKNGRHTIRKEKFKDLEQNREEKRKPKVGHA